MKFPSIWHACQSAQRFRALQLREWLSLLPLRDAIQASTDKPGPAAADSGEDVFSGTDRLETMRATITKRIVPKIEIRLFLFSRPQQGKAGPQPSLRPSKLGEALTV